MSRGPTASSFFQDRPSWGAVAAAACGGAIAVGLYSASHHYPAHATALQVAALLCVAITLYASGIVPGFMTSLLVFLVAAAGDLAPVPVVFSGFSSGAVWLLLSGIVIGMAATETGLGELIAAHLLARIRLTYGGAIVLLTTLSMLLGFLVPAALPRIIMLMPVTLGIAAAMGYEKGGRGYTGLAIAVAAGSFYPALSIMTATLPGIVFAGATEATHGISLSYARFLFYQFPVLGLLRWVFLMMLLAVLFREPSSSKTVRKAPPRMTMPQIRLAIILFALLAFWITDSFHHVAPAWAGLGAALIILLPRAGLLSCASFARQADLTPLIYVAGIISLGAIVNDSGLGRLFGLLVVDHYPAGVSVFPGYISTALFSSLACLLVTAPAAPTLLVPLAQSLSDVGGLSLEATLMTQFAGLSAVLLPFQAPPLVVGAGLFGIASHTVTRIALLMFVATVLIIFPLNFFWWKLVGLIP